MANYDNLIASIKGAIKNNNKQSITGQVLQDAMLEMVSQLGKNYAFGGVATPSTNPGTPTTNTFYIATEAGTYTKMGGAVLSDGELAFISWNGEKWKNDKISIGQNNAVNTPDEEDITMTEDKKLKLKDRSFGDGMGYVILRKNKTFAEQVKKSNTIYEIRYDFDLGGATITMPEGCELKFEGGSLVNGGLALNRTRLSGIVNIHCNVIGSLSLDSHLSTAWFGIDNSGQTDVTEKLRMLFLLAYTSSYTQEGWRNPIPINIMSGTYLTTDSLITSDMMAGRFIVKGDNAQIHHIGNVPLLNNLGVVGFTRFDGITFVGNGSNQFAIMQGGGSGNVQSFTFNNCSWVGWENITTTTGSTMASEFTFNDCKVNSCGNVDNPCELFVFNNEQGVNWRFFATDVESIVGCVFKYLKGATVDIEQGSFILNGIDETKPSVFISVPSDAIDTSFGENNSPIITVFSSRFELRGYVQLIRKESYTANTYMSFINAGLGGYNLTQSDSVSTIHLSGAATITFGQCQGYRGYSVYSKATNVNPRAMIIRCDSSAMIEQFLNNTRLSETINNMGGHIHYVNSITGETREYVDDGIQSTVSSIHKSNVIEETFNLVPERNVVCQFNAKEERTVVFNKKCRLKGLHISKAAFTSWGDTRIKTRCALILPDNTEVFVLNENFYSNVDYEVDAIINKEYDIVGIKLYLKSAWENNAIYPFRGVLTIKYI